jgi:hypothetical protein
LIKLVEDGVISGVIAKEVFEKMFESGRAAASPGYIAWRAALSAGHVPLERLATGERLALDDATLSVLWPDDGRVRPAGLDSGATDNRITNDSSIVLLGEYEGRRERLRRAPRA